jgi:xanthine dehydrogenase accessory factor
MDRSLDILRTTLEWIEEGRPFAVALILEAEGSTPRRGGARALIDGSGAIAGTIGGGLLEAEAQRRAVEVCRSGKPEIVEVALRGADPKETEPLCGGSVRVLLDPTAPASRAAYRAALEALRRRERGALVTTVRRRPAGIERGGGKEGSEGRDVLSVSTEWLPSERLPAESLSVEGLSTESPLRESLPTERLVEPILPDPRLLIVGGGHIGQALSRQACLLGFETTVVDDRPEFTDPALYPAGVATRTGDIAREVGAFPIAADTFVAIVTRGHRHDAEALAACVRSPAAYIGMIGSRRKVALLREELIRSGRATEEDLDRVRAPIGLDIGAVTVPEIAVSIAGQLVSVRRKGSAPP